MSASSIRLIAVALLMFHGIGHYMGILSTFGIKMTAAMSADSRLLTDLLGENPARIIAFLVWTVSLAGFICAGLSLGGWIIPVSAWQLIALISSVISLTGIILFWNAFAFMFNKIGALIVDIAVIISITSLHCPAVLFTE
jgi:hypothetical protein